MCKRVVISEVIEAFQYANRRFQSSICEFMQLPFRHELFSILPKPGMERLVIPAVDSPDPKQMGKSLHAVRMQMIDSHFGFVGGQ